VPRIGADGRKNEKFYYRERVARNRAAKGKRIARRNSLKLSTERSGK